MTTYNCGDSVPSPEMFSSDNEKAWLHNMSQYDMVVIGLQECNHSRWNIFLQKQLSSQFVQVSVITMWKMMLTVYVKKSLRDLVYDV